MDSRVCEGQDRMGDSDRSTIPNTPEADSEEAVVLDQDEVFAWLRPFNDIALKAFDATVNLVIKHKLDHFRHFLHCDSRQSRSQSIFTEDGDSSHNEPQPSIYQWVGAFGLRLTYLPLDTIQGWCIGTNDGRIPSRPLKEIDLLLAPHAALRTETRIAGHHATLNLHKQSCRIILQAKHTTTISSNGAKTFRHPDSFLLEHGEIILLGNCAYTFEYTDYFRSPAFEQAITEHMRKYHESLWSMNKYVSPGSVGLPTALGEYYCSPSAFDDGTFGRVSAGWSQNGATVAIKTFKNPNKSEIYSHVKLMETIGRHENVIQLLKCTSHFDTKVPDAYCIYTPLALANLSEIILSYTPDDTAKSALFTDYLSGLSYLHEQKGIMHRDIKPSNLAVLSLHQPKGIIIDLDAATPSITSTDHKKGTLPCLAPEIMELKNWNGRGTQPPPFRKSVDIWALGLAMYALYTERYFDWKLFDVFFAKQVATVTLKGYLNFQEELTKKAQAAENPDVQLAFLLVKTMSTWEAGKRETASSALSNILQTRRSHNRGLIGPKKAGKRQRDEH
ncbi:MAG: hypothetical protein Q9219_007142 [cf. Caloplaca sp. 3 TL-2023]